MRAELKAYEYGYRIRWSGKDRGYVATVAEWPAITSPPADTPHAALQSVIKAVVRELRRCDAEGRPRPSTIGRDDQPITSDAS
mgnify:FL=1